MSNADVVAPTDFDEADSNPASSIDPVDTIISEPTPTVADQPLPELVGIEGVILRNANLRSGPGTDFAVVDVALAGDVFTIIERTSDGWLRLDREGQVWVGSSLVRLDGNVMAIPLIETD